MAKTHIVELNDLSLMMLSHLRDVMAQEPQIPGDAAPRFAAEEMTAAHYEWSRQRDAIRILLGVHLVNLALDQLTHPERREV